MKAAQYKFLIIIICVKTGEHDFCSASEVIRKKFNRVNAENPKLYPALSVLPFCIGYLIYIFVQACHINLSSLILLDILVFSGESNRTLANRTESNSHCNLVSQTKWNVRLLNGRLSNKIERSITELSYSIIRAITELLFV